MPEHVHLLLSEPERGRLSIALQMLKQITRKSGIDGTYPSSLIAECETVPAILRNGEWRSGLQVPEGPLTIARQFTGGNDAQTLTVSQRDT